MTKETGQAGTEIEITPEMIEAGAAAISPFVGDDGLEFLRRRAAEEAYIAMYSIRPPVS